MSVFISYLDRPLEYLSNLISCHVMSRTPAFFLPLSPSIAHSYMHISHAPLTPEEPSFFPGTFPKYLMIKLGRYYTGSNWVQVIRLRTASYWIALYCIALQPNLVWWCITALCHNSYLLLQTSPSTFYFTLHIISLHIIALYCRWRSMLRSKFPRY